MTIPDLYALLERLAANADENKRYRDAAEINDGLRAVEDLANGITGLRGVERWADGSCKDSAAETLEEGFQDVITAVMGDWPSRHRYASVSPRRGGILR